MNSQAQLEQQEETELNEDLWIHEDRLKKALEAKETIIADKQETLIHNHQMEHSLYVHNQARL